MTCVTSTAATDFTFRALNKGNTTLPNSE